MNNENPLLSRVQMPGETFRLPSGGIFYNNGELDETVSNAEVRVYPMTVIDEIVIKTPDMLFSGEAVNEVFSRCIPQIKEPKRLLAKDVDFLLLCLRKVSYGNMVEFEHAHVGCKKVDKPTNHTYSVDVNHFIQNTKSIDPTTVSNVFSVKLPNEQVVKMQPIRFDDFVDLMQAQEDGNLTPQQHADKLVNSLSNIIVSVDEIGSQDLIIEWLRQVSPNYITIINDKIEETVKWGPDFMYTVACKDCGEKQEIMAPLNPLVFFI